MAHWPIIVNFCVYIPLNDSIHLIHLVNVYWLFTKWTNFGTKCFYNSGLCSQGSHISASGQPWAQIITIQYTQCRKI
jgi:hypothetical protein